MIYSVEAQRGLYIGKMCIMTYVRCVGEENNDKWETILGHGGVLEVIFDK